MCIFNLKYLISYLKLQKINKRNEIYNKIYFSR